MPVQLRGIYEARGGDGPVLRLEAPKGFNARAVHDTTSSASGGARREEDIVALKEKKAWDLAKSPVQKLFMTGFMLYMSGGGVHIFSIIITFMAVSQPLTAILGTQQAFSKLEGTRVSLIPQKAVYVVINLGAFAFALYRCATMGLLPTTPADWLSWVTAAPTAHAAGSIA